MRSLVLSLALCSMLGCNNNNNPANDQSMSLDGGMDQAAPVDLAIPDGDFAVPPPDLVFAPDLAPVQGVVVLADVSTTQPPATDGGAPQTVHLLVPSLRFAGTVDSTVHDYSSGPPPFNCVADHFDQMTGKLPVQDLDAGKVVITGYSGGQGLGGEPLPNEIDCIPVMGFYQCGYGPIDINAQLGLSPLEAPFAAGVTPIAAGQTIEFNAAGGYTIAPFDVTATAAGPLMVMEDLTQTLWDPTRSLTFHYSCPDNANGSCGNDVVVVDIYASANVPAQINQVTPSFGHLVCTQPANGGSVMVPQKALAALLGCKANGTTCDNALMSVRTMILRFTPAPQQDQNGDAITAGAGHGAYAVNPR